MTWLARIFAPVWRELVYIGGAILAALAILGMAKRDGARDERLRQMERDNARARQIRDAVARAKRVRDTETRYRD
jgi:hypothetical protein